MIPPTSATTTSSSDILDRNKCDSDSDASHELPAIPGEDNLSKLTESTNKLSISSGEESPDEITDELRLPNPLNPREENKLCKSMDKIDKLFEVINELSYDSGRLRTTVITLQNDSQYPLEYLSFNNKDGRLITPIGETFGCNLGNRKFIAKNYCGGIVHTDSAGGPSIASISFMVEVLDVHYTVCLVWYNTHGCNRVGGEVRFENGPKDMGGNVLGHGYDPSSAVIDHHAAASHVYSGPDLKHRIRLVTTRSFFIECEFDNNKCASYDFFVLQS